MGREGVGNPSTIELTNISYGMIVVPTVEVIKTLSAR